MPEQAPGAKRVLTPETFWLFLYEDAISVKPGDPLGGPTLPSSSVECSQCINELSKAACLEDSFKYDPDPAAKAAAATVLASKLGADSGLQLYMCDESHLSGASTGKSNDVELVQSSGLRNRKQVQNRSTSPRTTAQNFADQQLVGSAGFDQTQIPEYDQPVVVEHQPQNSTPQDGGWIARIAALLVGEDPTQSYALICGNCHMHNGLARKEDFPFITYYCPHCHALNKPKQLDGSISPKAGSVQMDERILALPSPKARSPKTGDGEAVLNASTSAIPEIEEVSERTSLEEKSD